MSSFSACEPRAKAKENGSRIWGDVVSPDCSFSIHLELLKVDLATLGRKVLNYGVWGLVV